MNQMLYDDLGKLVVRLTVGGLMLLHGIAKLGSPTALDWIGGQLQGVGLPSFIAYGVYIGEIIAPLMVIAGVSCRIGALIVCANMLFAIGLAHGSDLFVLKNSGGWALELQGFYLLCGAVVAMFGSGRFAIRPD